MIFDRGVARIAKGAVQGPIKTLTLDNPAGWLTGEDVSLSTDRAMKVSTVNRCVEVLSNSAAILPVYIMNEVTKERLSGHRLGRVLWGRANEAMTSFDYEKLQGCNKYLSGNAYGWIHRAPSTGYPQELIPLPPDYVTPWVDAAGRLWYIFQNPATGEPTKLHPADVLHYKAYTKDGITGISVLTRAAQVIATAQAAQQYEEDIYRNGGRPSGVLAADADLNGDMSITQADGSVVTINKKEYLRQEFERVHAGAGKRFRVAVLDLGLKYQPIGMNNTDAQFVESSEVRVADVCRFFGVPLHMVYAGKQSYESNENNALEFVKFTMQPDLTQREQEDTHKLLLPGEQTAGLRIKRELKALLRGDTASQIAWYRGMREIGAYNVDEIRGLEDLPEVPGGGARNASLNYVPLEHWPELSRLRAERGKGGNQSDE